MRRLLLASATLFLTACGSPSGGTSAAPTPVASPAAEAFPVAAAPSAAPPPTVAASPTGDGRIDDGLAAMAGSWTVDAVRVKPSDVQALTEDDPSDMGAVLDISRDRLAWRPREQGTFADVCDGPKLTLDGQISCQKGEFGPPGAQLRTKGDRLRLDWYDGATLELRKAR